MMMAESNIIGQLLLVLLDTKLLFVEIAEEREREREEVKGCCCWQMDRVAGQRGISTMSASIDHQLKE